ncbi:hypothetical protein C5F48_20290 [Cereibacter changlensis JA139]|uniref:HTH cro/C1-type domain-containing protein n=3 Tax=Cereibacter changlensis TaxID=402884 RepID=A0A2T4JPV6_9RHOB|nr:hypothetical protein C5F48_20290 [Cereibacter changlensis JA139]
MQLDQKIALAMTGDDSKKAQAIRLRAARHMIGLDQKTLGSEVGLKKTAISNMEMALSYPSLPVMRYLYRAHRVDFNFMMNGDFAQLPGDVQASLFPHLEDARREWDRKES